MALLKANETFWVKSLNRHIYAGQVIRDDDPFVKGREHLFVSADDGLGPVESATAAPGEKRAVKKAAAKPKVD